MVTRSLFTGVSGLQSHMTKMDTLSDNLSNINTPGFKKSQTIFKSFLSESMSSASRPTESRGGTNPQQIGLGVQVGTINKDMSQGQLQRTGVNTDLAVQGEGFFEVRESGGSNSLFTRAGSFQIDANGRLVDPSSGNVVQGFNSTVEDGEINFNPDTATVDDIQISSDQEVIPGEATTQQEFSGNLGADADKGIDPITVDFRESAVKFEFERYHPVEKMYKFSAKWSENPPSGKQVGDDVTDQVTGRKLQGLMQLNEDRQVTDIYKNPDLSGNIGAARVETDRDNAGEFNIREDEMSIRDQKDFMQDLDPDVTDQYRILFGEEGTDTSIDNPPDASGDSERFIVQWRDSDGSWRDFELHDGGGDNSFNNVTGNEYGEVGEDFVLHRDSGMGAGGDERVGEIRINSDFWGDTDPDSIQAGDKIYFQAHKGDENEILQQSGEELRKEFRWGGSSSNASGVLRASKPEKIDGGGTLDSVFNYDEQNIDDLLDTSTDHNDIDNYEFDINFTGANTFEVTSPGAGAGDSIVNQDGSAAMSTDNDQQLFLNDPTDPANELGISISAENWNDTDDQTEIQFQLTEARSSDSGRPFMIAADGDGAKTALFAPSGGSNESDQPSSINFAPNLNDTSGIFDDEELVAENGSAAEAQAKTDDEVQIATSSDVYDSLGEQHTLSYRFEKKSSSEWIWHAENPTPVDSENPKMAGYGRLEFDSRGNLERSETFEAKTAQEQPPPGPDGDLDLERVYFNPPEGELQSDPSDPDSQNQDQGAEPVSILPDFSDTTQFAGESDVEITDQDGTSRGRLESLDFDESGILNGSYDNGDTESLAQVVLTNFRNPEGLEKSGGTYFAQSANSGIPTRGTPGAGGRGTITPGALERSNVDMSTQFTQLISTQRGFQANTKTIQTTDQMIQQLLQLR
ncbi:MAG: flagellar hook-basal body complex protein [bacterium]